MALTDCFNGSDRKLQLDYCSGYYHEYNTIHKTFIPHTIYKAPPFLLV